MTFIAINPGSGPVTDGSTEQSEANIKKFIEDLGIKNAEYKFLRKCDDGRHDYEVKNDKHTHEISMPALPIENVRYVGAKDQNIWNFPRLYVDGSSWIWQFALGVCFNDEED